MYKLDITAIRVFDSNKKYKNYTNDKNNDTTYKENLKTVFYKDIVNKIDKLLKLNLYINNCYSLPKYHYFNSWKCWNHIFDKTIENYKKDEFNQKTANQTYPILNNELYKIFNDDLINMVCDDLNKYYLSYLRTKLLSKNNNYLNYFAKDIKWMYDFSPNFEGKFKDKNQKIYFFAEKVEIKDKNPVIHFIGDIHSSFHSIAKIFRNIRGSFEDDTMKLLKNHYIFFTGDIIDRGPYGIECLIFILLLKYNNKNSVFILDGNHEDPNIYNHYNFSVEMNYQIKDKIIREKLESLLVKLPSVIFLDLNGKIFQINHGALSLEFEKTAFAIKLDRNTFKIKDFLQSQKKFLDLKYLFKDTNFGFSQYKWGDFTLKNGLKPPSGGRGKFGHNKVLEYLRNNNIECIISGHQDIRPFSYLPLDNSKKQLQIGTKNNGEPVYIGINRYNLIGFSNFKDKLSKDLYNFSLNASHKKSESGDLLACILSSCNIAKDLEFLAYGTLSLKN